MASMYVVIRNADCDFARRDHVLRLQPAEQLGGVRRARSHRLAVLS